MAQIVKKDKWRALRFLLVGDSSKQLRAAIHNRGHQSTTRTDIDFDIMLFNGTDKDGCITPFLYGDKPSEWMSPNIKMDTEWIGHYHSVEPFFPKVGVGRGAQFLNVMSGGKLWHRVNGHDSGSHLIKLTNSGTSYRVKSDHIQMMAKGHGGVILANATVAAMLETFSQTLTRTPTQQWADPEIIHYFNTNSLCVQPLPQDQEDKEFINFFFNEVEELADNVTRKEPF